MPSSSQLLNTPGSPACQLVLEPEGWCEETVEGRGLLKEQIQKWWLKSRLSPTKSTALWKRETFSEAQLRTDM
jgi:hypothetical protein